MSVKINIHDAQTRLPQLLVMVGKGEEIIIDQAGEPVARLVPVARKPSIRRPGSAKGKIVLGDDFDAPLPDSILDAFHS